MKSLGFTVCFAAGTPLRVPGGSVPIERLQPGDRVLNRDQYEPAAPVVAKMVEAVFVREGLVWHLQVGGQVIRTTAEHPFYESRKGWVACHDLAVGDLMLCEDGQWAAVEDLLDIETWQIAYNIIVENKHIYCIVIE